MKLTLIVPMLRNFYLSTDQYNRYWTYCMPWSEEAANDALAFTGETCG